MKNVVLSTGEERAYDSVDGAHRDVPSTPPKARETRQAKANIMSPVLAQPVPPCPASSDGLLRGGSNTKLESFPDGNRVST